MLVKFCYIQHWLTMITKALIPFRRLADPGLLLHSGLAEISRLGRNGLHQLENGSEDASDNWDEHQM